MIRVVFVLFILLLSACDVEQEGRSQDLSANKVVKQMQWVESTTVESLLAKNLPNNPTFLAVELDGNIKIPGLPRKLCEQVVDKKKYQLLEGMSDVVYNSEHAKLRVKTREFASDYNKKLLRFSSTTHSPSVSFGSTHSL